jgi:hypothetical protein
MTSCDFKNKNALLNHESTVFEILIFNSIFALLVLILKKVLIAIGFTSMKEKCVEKRTKKCIEDLLKKSFITSGSLDRRRMQSVL